MLNIETLKADGIAIVRVELTGESSFKSLPTDIQVQLLE